MKRTELSGGVRERLVRLPAPYQISRILSRREAVSSSAIKRTHSTLDELLIADEDDDQAGQTVRQVRDTR
ncbi:hypothetical protein JK176_14675 [Gluconobacter sp. Dm-73]|uniref:Fic/DOC family N-terminal domain-containing protein n=1 Tax=Gluconobacter sp. Dm-73 TaxID=2799802 RepID=UPI001B8CEAFE|nr:Fic/DOC family N-terminal domain-containing protein [Gluconobacter sp. Dm-73]MBS1076099.1 hypothetical protein [Gluconobacter sp. Dm-73]